MDVSEDEGRVILDISRSGPSTSTDVMDVESTAEVDFNQSTMSPSSGYFEATEEEQQLVGKFLDGEIDFDDYLKGVCTESATVEADEIEPQVEEEGPSSPKPSTSKYFEIPTSVKASQRRKLPPALKGLMGEANLRLARGDRDTAVTICLEIIRQVPMAPDAFLTLASIYEEMGDEEKYLQMALIAAYLGPADVFQWSHLAELCEKHGNYKQAISCYSKAIKLDLQNLDLHQKRAALLEAHGDKKLITRGYFRLLTSLNPETQSDYLVYLAKFLAEMCHKEGDVARASEALSVAIAKCPSAVNIEFVNLQLELLIQLKEFEKCIKLLEDFCEVVVSFQKTKEGRIKVKKVTTKPSTAVDIVVKLIIVLIHLGGISFIPRLIEPLEDTDLDETGDLYLDVAEAYAEKGFHAEAEPLLEKLAFSGSFNLPGVWLKYAEVLKALGKTEEAVDAYYVVISRAPQHVDARLTLASLLVEMGRSDEAIAALTQREEEQDCLDLGLLYERCLLLKRDSHRSQELIMVAQVLFSRHSTQIRNKDELSSMIQFQRYDRKRSSVKQVRKSRKEPEGDDEGPTFKGTKAPSVEEEWALFKHVCTLCLNLKMYPTLQRLTFTAQLSTVFHVYKLEIDIMSVIAAVLNNDSYHGYNLIRALVTKNPDNVRLWHLFNLVINKSDEARHSRFVMRQLSRNSEHTALGILHGNNCLVAGTYKYAMHEYSGIYRKTQNPLAALLLGLTYLQMAGQKFTSKKHLLVVQAVGLLSKYKELRGGSGDGDQEAHYNLARGFHHLGLYSAAIYHYERVLELAPATRMARELPEVFDLSREAAFNLHLIYSMSESYDLARHYLDKYIVV